MEREVIEKAIERARRGIGQYLEIMELFPSTNVSKNRDFQRKFNYFYRVKQQSPDWYAEYYRFMEEQKGENPEFSNVLAHFYSVLGRCEPSFSSKFVATHNPDTPIWDAHVLRNTGVKPPSYGSKNRISKTVEAYRRICNWYEDTITSDRGQLIIESFNSMVESHEKISDLKKIDFVLWQIRE